MANVSSHPKSTMGYVVVIDVVDVVNIIIGCCCDMEEDKNCNLYL
jgi:hypothetical protein